MTQQNYRRINKQLESIYNQLNNSRNRDTLLPHIHSLEDTIHPVHSRIREHLRTVYNSYPNVTAGTNLIPMRIQDILTPDERNIAEDIYGSDSDDETGDDYPSSSDEEEGGHLPMRFF